MVDIASRHTINNSSQCLSYKNKSETDNPTRNPVEVAFLENNPSSIHSTSTKRLATFTNWPNKNISPRILANAGFYYFGLDDVVKCAFCYIEGHHWMATDNPMDDHRSWNPNCPFIQQSEHDNATYERTTLNGDTCGKYGVEILPNSVPEGDLKSLEKLGIQKNKGPTHPEYITYESRLKSFTDWPKSMKQKPVDLASAGFFYLGVGDQTLCFHCGGGLKDWEESDDPWEQHAFWFSKCTFLILKKGSQFIEDVKSRKDPELSQPGTSAGSSQTKEEASTLVAGETGQFNKGDSKEEEKTLCKICFKNELGVVFLPCGHIVACVDCASALKTCAVCRKPLEATVRAFLS